jgi:lysophospholipase L1-like esterase
MKIACMGDSITFGECLPAQQGRWTDLVQQRTGHTLVNLGISGDTTAGMLARCQSQVFGRDFDAMILLGGTNDISYTSDYRQAWANILAIYCQCKSWNLPLILGIPLPMIGEMIPQRAYYPGRDNVKNAALLAEFSRLLKIYCGEKGIPCADFRQAFLDEAGCGRAELFFDGLHPTAQGHERMAQVLCRTLEQL